MRHRRVLEALAHSPTVRVIVSERREQLVDRPFCQKFLGIERLFPCEQVFGRRVKRTRGIGNKHVQGRCVDKRIAVAKITGRAPFDHVACHVVTRVLQAERPKDILFEKFGIRLARCFLDNKPEQVIARIAVGISLANRKIERLCLIFRQQFRRRDRKHGLLCHPVRERGVVGNSGRVGKQVADRYRLPCRRAIGNILAHAVAGAESPAFLQEHDRRRCKLLRYRAQAKDCPRRIRNVPLVIRHAVSFAYDRFSVTRDEDRPVEPVNLLCRRHILIDARYDLICRRRLSKVRLQIEKKKAWNNDNACPKTLNYSHRMTPYELLFRLRKARISDNGKRNMRRIPARAIYPLRRLLKI